MKTRKIFLCLLAAGVVVAMVSCKKNRYCHCVSESYQTVTLAGDTTMVADTVVLNVDRGLKCEHILEFGFQKLQDGDYVTSTRKVDCVELDMDTVSTIPPRPEEED